MADTKIKISVDAANAQASLRTLGNSVDGLTKNFFTLSGTAGRLAGALSIVSFAGFVKSAINLQDELAVLSEKTGTSVEALAGLKYAAEQNDTSLEAVANSAKKLSSNLAASPELFKKLGISATDSTGAMIQLADLFASMPDGIQKSALAVKLMGKSGEEMIPFMNQGGESLRKFIEQGKKIYPVTTDGAKAAREFNDQMKALEAQASGLGIEITRSLLPGLVETTTRMNELAAAGHPVLALWRGLAGMGKVAWDFLSPPENIKKSLLSENMVKDLQVQIESLQNKKKSGNGKLMQMMFGTPEELDAEINMLKARIDTIKKHAAELDKPAATPIAAKKVVPKTVSDILNPETSRPNGIVKALETDFNNSYQKKLRDLNSTTMSAVDKQYADNLADISMKTDKARVDLEKYYAVKEKDGVVTAAHIKDLAALDAAEKQQIANMDALRSKTEELNASWAHGGKVALQNYIDDVSNVSKQTEKMFTSAFKGMEDGLVQFVQTGKLDFRTLADSIVADLLRIQIQQMEMGMLKSISGMFGGNGKVGEVNTTSKLDYTGGYSPAASSIASKSISAPLALPAGVQSRGAMQVTSAPVINIDSRTDQAEVHKLVTRAVAQGNAQLVDRLQRQGAL
jgi:hypothetical protein